MLGGGHRPQRPAGTSRTEGFFPHRLKQWDLALKQHEAQCPVSRVNVLFRSAQRTLTPRQVCSLGSRVKRSEVASSPCAAPDGRPPALGRRAASAPGPPCGQTGPETARSQGRVWATAVPAGQAGLQGMGPNLVGLACGPVDMPHGEAS